MILETKNIQENDIIIYSRNSMDEHYNFRIIFKNDPDIHHRIISFEQVIKLITEYFPKNLIAYRILCNLPDITVDSVKYGCVIITNNHPELIFTDPVFAVQTIEEYIRSNHNMEFKFKIQKVGYTTFNQLDGKANFKEEFATDLNINEAINQNDESYIEKLIEKRISNEREKKTSSEIKRNIIFKPENQDKLGIIEKDTGIKKTKRDAVTQKLTKRNEREAEGKMTYAGNSLILGKIERLQAEKKQIDFPFLNERQISMEDFQILEISRISQQKQRKPLEKEKKINTDKSNELQLNFDDSKMDAEENFKKVKSMPPVMIRRVEIDENGSQKQVEAKKTKNHKDDLFSNFLNNLQSESNLNLKSDSREYKESNIIQMFKSLQSAGQKNNDNQNNILKPGNNNKLE